MIFALSFTVKDLEGKKTFIKNSLKRLKKIYNPFILTFSPDDEYFKDVSDEIVHVSGENAVSSSLSIRTLRGVRSTVLPCRASS